MEKGISANNPAVAWVLSRCEDWRDHRDTNYLEDWKEYERLWRGIWDRGDATRDSERSKIITPMLQQAVETFSAEIDEAIFGRGEKFFDIVDDDQDPQDVEMMKKLLTQDFKKDKVRKAVSDIVLLAAIYGTGIGEVVVTERMEKSPDTEPMPEMGVSMYGVREKTRFAVQLRPISPKNFLIDPNASTIEEAVGCAVEEFVGLASVVKGMEDGMYKKVDITGTAVDSDLEPVQEEIEFQQDRVKLLRYYGLVPRKLIKAGEKGDYVDLFKDASKNFGYTAAEYTDMVEAIIVIANDQHLL